MLKFLNFKNSRQKGFSMLEMAIVLFVASIVTIVAVSGSRFVKYARRTSAMTMTANSPVSRIDDLALWVETSLDGSYEADSNDKVSIWYDRSGRENDLEQTTADYQPELVRNAIKGTFPALKFDGVNDTLLNTVNEYYSPTTLFMVFKADNKGASNFLFANVQTSVPETNNGFQIYINSSDEIIFNYFDNTGASPTVPSFGTVDYNNVAIISVVLDGVDVIKGYYNGSLIIDLDGTEIPNGFKSKYRFYGIGRNRYGNSFFKGYIAEVILYDKALGNSERETIENYLSNKYRININ